MGFDIEVLAELYPTETTADGATRDEVVFHHPQMGGTWMYMALGDPDINFELLTVINNRINESQVTILILY